ncbi:MAG TPA: TIGR03435 family protein [Bryobacteraceae bacterium]|nr:TIGR03435 family protein [Bryobacteraceae bacterium]
MRRVANLGAVVLGFASLAAAQTPPVPQFEVASVKASPPPTGNVVMRRMGGDPGMVNWQNVTLQMLVAKAYSVKDYQVSGPGWMDGQGFDVTAKLPAGASQDQIPAMLQKLLADRFRLTLHRETKDLPVYALIIDKGGPKMKEADPADLEAAKALANNAAGYGAPPPPPPPGGKLPAGAMMMRMSAGGARHMQGMQTTASLATMLSNVLDRPVLDMTGLTKIYNVDLSWTPDDRERMPALPPGMPPPSGAGPGMDPHPAEAAADAGAPSIFSAVQQELGLKLEASKAQTEFLVIDHAEKTPTEN